MGAWSEPRCDCGLSVCSVSEHHLLVRHFAEQRESLMLSVDQMRDASLTLFFVGSDSETEIKLTL